MDRRDFRATVTAAGVGGFGGWAGRRSLGETYRLRPPGAVSEWQFLSHCIRCHHCVTACPVEAIRVANEAGPAGVGTPIIEPRRQPCDLCAGQPTMRCIEACPTEALRSGTTRRRVAIGVARIDADTCLPFQGVACRACWRACPFPGDAITQDSLGRPRVDPRHCTGCGLCVHACLTDPPSIVVEPFASKEPREEKVQG